MAGHKFGAAGDPSFTWAMNVAVPFMVAETFRDSRIVAFSTACVYPYVDVHGAGAPETMATTPPPGDYANSCVGREQMFLYVSRRHGTPGRLVRLSYAIDMRYGVLYDVATAVFEGSPVALGMGCERHLAGRRQRAGAAAPCPLHLTGEPDQHQRS
jgi:nucleoside-diphosphate-sugar epimerase